MTPLAKTATLAVLSAIAWAGVYGAAKLGVLLGNALARVIGL